MMQSPMKIVVVALAAGFALLGLGSQVCAQVRMVTPEDRAVILGPTTFSFDVESGPENLDRVDVYVAGSLAGSATAPDWTLQWNAPTGLQSAKIVAAVFADQALVQRIEIQTADLRVDEFVNVVAVELYPVVVDARGAYVKDLARDDFVILDRGQPVPIENFSQDVASLHVAILIDTSESMKQKLAAVQEAAIEFVDSLAPGDELAVYSFDHTVDMVADWSVPRSKSRSAIRGLSTGGSTALYDAVSRLATDLSSKRGRKVILVFSDGRDEGSMASLDHAIRTVRSSNTILYTLASGKTKEDLEARKDLQRLARETGGQSHGIQKLKGLSRVFTDVLNDLRAQYSLSFHPRASEPGVYQVKVRAVDADLSVRCRSTYAISSQ